MKKSAEELYFSALRAHSEPVREQLHYDALMLVLDRAWKDIKSTDGDRSFSHPLRKFAFDNGVHAELVQKVIDDGYDQEFQCLNIAPNRITHLQHTLTEAGKGHWIKPPRYTREEALEIVIAAFARFHPEMAVAARAVVEEGRIDFAPTLRGALCYSSAKDANPLEAPPLLSKVSARHRHKSFVSMSLDKRSDNKLTLDELFILAHELAHAAAFDMGQAAGKKVTQSDPLNETFSYLGEQLLADYLLHTAPSPYQKFMIAREMSIKTESNLCAGYDTALQHNPS